MTPVSIHIAPQGYPFTKHVVHAMTMAMIFVMGLLPFTLLVPN
jgi:hypothetical protein